jgi:DNA-binding NarL/FixJ family response regulator
MTQGFRVLRLEVAGPKVDLFLRKKSQLRSYPLQGGKVHLVRILVADDNPVVRHYLRGLLEQQSTWRVCDEARTGGEALERVRNNRPDMILLDFQMPDLNGLDVARKIAEVSPEIPILMVTIHLSRQLADEARKAGIRGVCLKSDVGSIVEAVDTLLHERTYFPLTAATSN